MKTSKKPTLTDIDELLSFLPRLYKLKGKYTKGWVGGETGSDGVTTLPWPTYRKVVKEFFRSAGKECWSDYDYNPSESREMISDIKNIRSASIDDIKTMLTWCVRGERFCDGHWENVLKDGVVFAILERIYSLREHYSFQSRSNANSREGQRRS